jgi:uncharacterized protein (DUF433 family)
MSASIAETKYKHIELNDEGVPVISGTNMKVIELVLNKISHGWSPEELHFQHPYLTLGGVHSALAYYWDHQAEMERDIERRLRKVQQIRKESGSSQLAARLKAKGMF